MLIAFAVGGGTLTIEGSEVSLVVFVIALTIGLLIFLPLLLLRNWFFFRRRLKVNDITSEFSAPLDLKPADIAYLYKTKLGSGVIAATIIGLVNQNYLKLVNTGEGKMLELGKNRQEGLTKYELKIVLMVKDKGTISGRDLVKEFEGLSTINRGLSIHNLVKADLASKGYVKKNYTVSFMRRSAYIAVVLFVLTGLWPMVFVWSAEVVLEGYSDFSSLFKLFGSALRFGFATIPVYFVLGALVTYLKGLIVGREWVATPRLIKSWPQIIGFRQYVKLLEVGKLQFNSAELEKKSAKDTLSYAVALGFVKSWKRYIS